MENLLVFLETQFWALVLTVCVAGLLVGSFLNVVILRLPVMMERQWQREARQLLSLPEVAADPPRFNLVTPASHCPNCKHRIRWFENLPVISWLVLRAKCAKCSQPIPLRYPAVELMAAVLGVLAVFQAGYGLWLLCLLGAIWALLALAVIDFDTTLLPDSITLPLLWAGILAALTGVSPVSLSDAVLGAVGGYLTLWSVYWLFRLLTGKEGMGYGDFKLLAALGAWLGWQLLPMVILLSSVVGAVIGGIMLATGIVNREQGIPFGPYLAGAGFISLLWGNSLADAWLSLFRL